jgi:hypothetical protein
VPGPLATAWRRTGAELPWGDLAATRGTAFEGWYWRLVDPAGGRVLVVLCGAMREGWALGALAFHPGGFVRERIADGREDLIAGDLAARIAADATVDVELRPVARWPRRAFGALGPVHLLPHLPQYWQPLTLRATAHGSAQIGGERVPIDGWLAYHEKNWGPQFAGDWWWGQAAVAEAADVAFAGGRVGPAAPTAVVFRIGDEIHAIAPPALVRTRIGEGTWHVRARSPRFTVTIDAEGSDPHVLPVPHGDRRVVPRSHQVLAGTLELTVTRGRRTLLRESTTLAGLERGHPRGQTP